MSRHTVLRIAALVVVAACQARDESLSTTSAAVAGTDRLHAGEILLPGEYLISGSTTLTYQTDNNLVLYQFGIPLWHTHTFGRIPNSFQMQFDCNAVVYNLFGASWASHTNGWGDSCVARVIEGDWFICSGSTRVFSARGGGNCDEDEYVCSETSFGVPFDIEELAPYRVRIEPDYLYVCDTANRYELPLFWPQPSQDEVDRECIGACGAGCSPFTCTKTGVGNYIDMGDGQACRDVVLDCYSSDCCWYHDLCGRLFPGSLFLNPFCHVLAIVYGCAPCIGLGFPGCSVDGYPKGFFHSYTMRDDCICIDRPGDCTDDCTGECFAGCDLNFDCRDDCTGSCVPGCDSNFDCVDDCTGLCRAGCDLNLDCTDDCTGGCAPGCDNNFDCRDDCTDTCRAGCDDNGDCFDDCTGGNLCYPCPDFGRGLCCGGDPMMQPGTQNSVGPVVVPDLTVHVGSQTKLWRSDELAAVQSSLAAMNEVSSVERDGLSTRSGWSLRALVHSKLGPHARVAAVIDENGVRVELDPGAWQSTDSVPILRVNRKGGLRFQWLGAQKTLPGLKGVKAIQVIAAQRPE